MIQKLLLYDIYLMFCGKQYDLCHSTAVFINYNITPTVR